MRSMQAESTIPAHFLEKRYYSWNNHLREVFGEKVFKVAIDGGFTCPDCDGTAVTFSCSSPSTPIISGGDVPFDTLP